MPVRTACAEKLSATKVPLPRIGTRAPAEAMLKIILEKVVA